MKKHPDEYSIIILSDIAKLKKFQNIDWSNHANDFPKLTTQKIFVFQNIIHTLCTPLADHVIPVIYLWVYFPLGYISSLTNVCVYCLNTP